MNSKTKTSSVTTSKKTNNTKVQKITRKKVRLFFYGGAKSDADNNTFLSAAKTVKYDYEKDNEGNIKIKEIYEIKDAEDIIEKISFEEDNSIESIDFFSHGGEVALYVKHMNFLGKDFNQSLYMSAEVEKQFETFLGYSSNLSEINYNKFSNTAIIEIHGCKTASIDKKYNNINFAMTLSKYLYDAGKVKSFVIGHVTNANPNQHKTLQGNDYRHGGRRIYHNGLEFLFTREEGRITSKKLNDMLNK